MENIFENLTDLEKHLLNVLEDIQNEAVAGLSPTINNLSSKEDWLEYHLSAILKRANSAIKAIY